MKEDEWRCAAMIIARWREKLFCFFSLSSFLLALQQLPVESSLEPLDPAIKTILRAQQQHGKKTAAAAAGALVRSRMQFTVFFSFYQELVHLLQLGWARKFWSRIAELFWVLGVFLTDAILCRMWWFRKSRELSLKSGGCWVVGYVFACTRFIVVFSFSFPFFAKEGELDIYIHWETMPTTSPASFMDVLSEDPQRVFHKDMGCMTGILQIFDRHPALTAQRYSSRCNPNLHGLSPNFLCLSSRLSVCHTLWSNSTKILPSAKWKMWVCVGERDSTVEQKTDLCEFFFSSLFEPAQIMPTASGKPYHELRSNPAYDMVIILSLFTQWSSSSSSGSCLCMCFSISLLWKQAIPSNQASLEVFGAFSLVPLTLLSSLFL